MLISLLMSIDVQMLNAQLVVDWIQVKQEVYVLHVQEDTQLFLKDVFQQELHVEIALLILEKNAMEEQEVLQDVQIA